MQHPSNPPPTFAMALSRRARKASLASRPSSTAAMSCLLTALCSADGGGLAGASAAPDEQSVCVCVCG